jgi:ribonuclease Y
VDKAFAIQAGREMRVIVMPTPAYDRWATKLANDIVKKLKEELKDTVDIKVTVLSETSGSADSKRRLCGHDL